MRVGNVFSHVCVSACMTVSVFLSVQAITFEPLQIETSFLVCRYVFTILRSLGQCQGHMRKMIILLIQTW